MFSCESMPVAHEVMENRIYSAKHLSVIGTVFFFKFPGQYMYCFQLLFYSCIMSEGHLRLSLSFLSFLLQTATDSSSNSSQKKELATQLVATSTFYEPHPHRCILQYRPPERYSLDQVRQVDRIGALSIFA